MNNFKLEYRNLEQRIIRELRVKVESSNQISKHINEKSINVNIYNYVELTIVNDKLTFLDDNGLHYSLWSDCSLEDLIDILYN